MTRLMGNEQQADDKAKLFVVFANIFIFTPLAWGFMSNVRMCVCVCVCVSVSLCEKLQCVAVCCSVLQCVPVCCNVLQYVAVCCSVMQAALR